MLTFASLLREVQGNAPAREAMSLLGTALARRSSEEQEAFWRAIDLYYVSRKAPGAETVDINPRRPDIGSDHRPRDPNETKETA